MGVALYTPALAIEQGFTNKTTQTELEFVFITFCFITFSDRFTLNPVNNRYRSHMCYLHSSRWFKVKRNCYRKEI